VGAGEGYVQNPEAMLQDAWDQAQRGVDVGDPTGLSQTVQAAILMSRGLGEQALEKVDGLDIQRPTCDVTFAVEGSVRRYMGQWEQAVDLTDTAMRLTAVNRPWYPTIQACSLYMGGRLEQAASTAEAVIAYQPNNLEALLVLVGAQQEMGLERRAKATADLIKDRYPATDIDEWLSNNPYQVPEMIDRWKEQLTAAGVIDPNS
jgi:tetratricopeptide (TPR) repeat protein